MPSLQILLPPSETKRVGGVAAAAAPGLHAGAELDAARGRVRAALEALSAPAAAHTTGEDPRPELLAAAKALGLGATKLGELEWNLDLGGAVMPAIERYTGVLYDGLAIDELDAAARGWIDSHVFVQSALFGLVRAGDLIPAYRLSAGSRLPALGAPLKRVWAAAHEGVIDGAAALVLDLRSKDYAALAPVPGAHALHVAQRSASGETRALNHFNKAAKGDLVARLARSGADISSLDELIAWAEIAGLELFVGDHGLTLVTTLGAPKAAA